MIGTCGGVVTAFGKSFSKKASISAKSGLGFAGALNTEKIK
jgi:hypothetical protein